MITVIVPVYNVYDYIDQCIESILAQDYVDFEVLLINDGSTDRSGEKCLIWTKRDGRIRLIEKANEGLAPTRNLGIDCAAGEYVVFLDSDDWLPPKALSQLVCLLESAKADFAAGAHIRYDNEANQELRVPHFPVQVITTEGEKKAYICEGLPELWGKIYRTSFLRKNHLYMPNLVHEDCAVFPQIVMCAKAIALTENVVYIYRINRKNSILDRRKNQHLIDRALSYSIQKFKEGPLWTAMRGCAKLYCERYLFGSALGGKSAAVLPQHYRSFLDSNFPEWNQDAAMIRTYCLGSFNLLWMYREADILMQERNPHHIFHQVEGVYLRNQFKLCFHSCFSSIAVINEPSNDQVPQNKNMYRQERLNDDWMNGLLRRLQETKPDVLFVDFIEERYDLLQLPGGKLVTKSEALDSSEWDGTCKRLIENGSEEFWQIWKEKCDNLILFLKKEMRAECVILVRNLLAEKYRKNHIIVEFEKQALIQNKNQTLNAMYDYFIAHYEGIQVVKVPKRCFVTDDKNKYGCLPEYYNAETYQEVGWWLSYAAYCNYFKKE